MFNRLFIIPLQSRDSCFIFGPRGTGKTYWLKTHLSQSEQVYIDLLEPLTYRRLKGRPEELRQFFSSSFQGWIILDEVQKIPELLDEVHRLIEHENKRFILTGSSARKLKRDGVNLLAGRAIHYHMHPLLIQELGKAFNLEHALTLGMLPSTYTYDNPQGYLATYVDTYLREEVMQEGLTRNISAFARFLEIASFSQGSMVNYSEIAREIAVERQVVQNYFSILHDLLLSHSLPAFTKRAKRKLILSEKFYFFDAGIYYSLRPKGLLDTPSEIAGAGLETLFYQSCLGLIDYLQLDYQLYYWKTVSGVEVDFIAYGQKALFAFEIKHNKKITPSMLRSLRSFKEDYPMAKLYILYLGDTKLFLDEEIIALPFIEGLKELPQILKG